MREGGTECTVRSAKPLSGVQKFVFGVCSRRSPRTRWCDRGCARTDLSRVKNHHTTPNTVSMPASLCAATKDRVMGGRGEYDDETGGVHVHG